MVRNFSLGCRVCSVDCGGDRYKASTAGQPPLAHTSETNSAPLRYGSTIGSGHHGRKLGEDAQLRHRLLVQLIRSAALAKVGHQLQHVGGRHHGDVHAQAGDRQRPQAELAGAAAAHVAGEHQKGRFALGDETARQHLVLIARHLPRRRRGRIEGLQIEMLVLQRVRQLVGGHPVMFVGRGLAVLDVDHAERLEARVVIGGDLRGKRLLQRVRQVEAVFDEAQRDVGAGRVGRLAGRQLGNDFVVNGAPVGVPLLGLVFDGRSKTQATQRLQLGLQFGDPAVGRVLVTGQAATRPRWPPAGRAARASGPCGPRTPPPAPRPDTNPDPPMLRRPWPRVYREIAADPGERDPETGRASRRRAVRPPTPPPPARARWRSRFRSARDARAGAPLWLRPPARRRRRRRSGRFGWALRRLAPRRCAARGRCRASTTGDRPAPWTTSAPACRRARSEARRSGRTARGRAGTGGRR